MNQNDPAEGKKASLLLNLESDCAVFASYERLFQSSAPLYLKFFFLPKFYIGRVRPKVQPLIFFIPFLTEKKTVLNILSLRGKTKSPDLSILK